MTHNSIPAQKPKQRAKVLTSKAQTLSITGIAMAIKTELPASKSRNSGSKVL